MKLIQLKNKKRELLLLDFFKYTMKVGGFNEQTTNILQDYEFLTSKFGPSDELRSEIFKFDDLALRYDLTMPLLANFEKKFTRFEVGTVFRNSASTSNRFKEFIQADLDSSIVPFTQILEVYLTFLNMLNIQYIVELNEVRITQEYFKNFPTEISKKYLAIIDKLKKKSKEELYIEIEEKNLDRTVFDQFINSKLESGPEVKEMLTKLKTKNNQIIFNPYLVRGLNFYNGIVCEIFLKNSNVAICAGGEYSLNDVQLSGLSIGISRLASLISLQKKVCLIVKDKNSLTGLLLNPYVEIINYEAISRSFKFFIKDVSKKYKALIMLGKEEINSNSISVKNFVVNKVDTYTLFDFLKNYETIITEL